MVKFTIRRFITYLFIALLTIWSVFPIYTIFLFSIILDRETIAAPTHWIPHEPTPLNYLRVLGLATINGRISGQAGSIISGIVNSVIIASVTTVVAIAVASLAGYAFARFAFPRKNAWLLSILLSRALPAAAMAIPYYYLFNMARLTGTHLGLIFTHLSFTLPLATWILLGYFATLPIDMEKAARVDGCGRLGVLRRVVLPMARGGVASVAIMVFLLSWSEFFFALILTAGTSAETLPPVLAAFAQVLTGIAFPTQVAAATVISLIPVIILGAIFQRYILRLKIVDPVTTVIEKEIPFG